MPPSDPVVEVPEVTNAEGGDVPVEEKEAVEPVEGEAVEGEAVEGEAVEGDVDQEERTAENPEGDEVPAYSKVDYSRDQRKYISGVDKFIGISWMLKTLMELDEFQISKVSNE